MMLTNLLTRNECRVIKFIIIFKKVSVYQNYIYVAKSNGPHRYL